MSATAGPPATTFFFEASATAFASGRSQVKTTERYWTLPTDQLTMPFGQ